MREDIGVLALKSVGSGADVQREQVIQTSKMTNAAMRNNIRLVNAFVCNGSLQQLEKAAAEAYKATPFLYLFVYSPADFCTNLRDYERFRVQMARRGIILQSFTN